MQQSETPEQKTTVGAYVVTPFASISRVSSETVAAVVFFVVQIESAIAVHLQVDQAGTNPKVVHLRGDRDLSDQIVFDL